MGITDEKILKNGKKFNESGLKYGVLNDNLLEMLGEEFFHAPCTTSEEMYNAYKGGLVQHILNVTKYALNINKSLPEDKQLNVESVVRVCLIHQIGKANMYVVQDNEWFVKNRGEHFKFNDEVLSLKASERSVYYALKSGINLTEDEVYAIYNSTSDFGYRKFKSNILLN